LFLSASSNNLDKSVITTDSIFGWDTLKMAEACTAHGLRKAGATIAANNGATAHQLMAATAWAR
jgi:hypothetical protein